MNGVEREVVEWRKEFITFYEDKLSKRLSKTTGGYLSFIDRLTGIYSGTSKCSVVTKGPIF